MKCTTRCRGFVADSALYFFLPVLPPTSSCSRILSCSLRSSRYRTLKTRNCECRWRRLSLAASPPALRIRLPLRPQVLRQHRLPQQPQVLRQHQRVHLLPVSRAGWRMWRSQPVQANCLPRPPGAQLQILPDLPQRPPLAQRHTIPGQKTRALAQQPRHPLQPRRLIRLRPLHPVSGQRPRQGRLWAALNHLEHLSNTLRLPRTSRQPHWSLRRFPGRPKRRREPRFRPLGLSPRLRLLPCRRRPARSRRPRRRARLVDSLPRTLSRRLCLRQVTTELAR